VSEPLRLLQIDTGNEFRGGQRQVALCTARFGRRDLDFTAFSAGVIIEGFLLGKHFNGS